jgi:hypothetical protein
MAGRATELRRWVLGASFAPLLGAAVLAAPRGSAAGSRVIIETGPHAGTYALPDALCLLDDDGRKMSVAYAHDSDDPERLTQALVDIYDMTAPVPGKTGKGAVVFGSAGRHQRPTEYDVRIPSPLTQNRIILRRNGRGYFANVDGRSQQGVSLHIALSCESVGKL